MKISISLALSLCLGVAFFTGLVKGVINPLNPSKLQFVSPFTETRECHSPEDCNPDECCVLGMDRYAIPQCQKKGQTGDWCRANALPEDRLLYYPDGTIINVKGVYNLFSTCAKGLVCFKTQCKRLN